MQDKEYLDFTNVALESFYDAVDDRYFKDEDARLIYRALMQRMRLVPFSWYLKRYIYNRAGLTGNYLDIPTEEYQAILRDSFRDNCTPASFDSVTSKLSALSRNWLTQQSVGRKVVFLLGFGLGMSVADVNQFLTKALGEREIRFKDPAETICWYCYKNQYNYLKYQSLWQAYEKLEPRHLSRNVLLEEQTAHFRRRAETIETDSELMEYLSTLKLTGGASVMSVSARMHFDRLYDHAREIIAGMYNASAAEKNERDLEQYREKLANNPRMYEYDKLRHIERRREKQVVFTKEDITPGDVERVICAAIPLDRHGNLMPIKLSAFREHFGGRKFSRQRLCDILAGGAEIDRFDLITLNFFVYSQRLDEYPDNKVRYETFIQSTNRILTGCGMGKLYEVNPYECFILMCVLAEDPLGTYADVWEMAYGNVTNVPHPTKGGGRP